MCGWPHDHHVLDPSMSLSESHGAGMVVVVIVIVSVMVDVSVKVDVIGVGAVRSLEHPVSTTPRTGSDTSIMFRICRSRFAGGSG